MISHVVGWNVSDWTQNAKGRGTLEKPGGVHLSPLDVAGEVDLVGQLGDVHLEPLLHLVQSLRVRLVTYEGDG